MFKPHFDLGIKSLLKDWRKMLSPRYLYNDMVAGIVVACIALPLSLAIALASGVPPEIGLVTAIVAGIVCAFFGGVPLAVSGPAAAMAVLVAAVVQEYGFSGLLIVGFGCGVLQLITGIIGLGAIIRFVPVPVVMGFTAGIGAIILIGQFPRILGLPAPPESHILCVIMHICDLVHKAQPAAFLLAISTIAINMWMPRVLPRLPSPLFAVIIPSLVAYFLHLKIDLVGVIPSSLPMPQFPSLPEGGVNWLNLMGTTFVVFSLASLETLLSAGSVDQLSKSKPHDPNQELIGQGLGNIASVMFSGIPATAVIARSAINVHAGAKTRRASIIHALFLLAIVYFLAPVMSQIPIAVLAGLLITIALRMCHPHEFLSLWHSARGDAYVYLVTFIMIVILGLLSGIQVGIIAALIFAAIRLSQVSIQLHTSQYGPAQLALAGPVTFLSVGKFDSFEKKLNETEFPSGVIIDLTKVKALDASGASNICNVVDRLHARNVKAVIYGLNIDLLQALTGARSDIKNYIANTELEMEAILGLEKHHHQLIMDRLIYGIEKFKKNLRPAIKAKFTSLAKMQDPHTLFITCSDSRIDPNLITSTYPGELFIVRNVGNIIPHFGRDDTPAEGAAVEYAVGILNVKQIIICSHSGCGAMQAVLSGQIFNSKNKLIYPCVSQWLAEVKKYLPQGINLEQAAKLNASMQIDNLMTYPIVRERVNNRSLKIQVLYYDIGQSDVQLWDEVLGRYTVIGESIQPVSFGANMTRGLSGIKGSDSNDH